MRELDLTLRPSVAMHQYSFVPHVCALGAALTDEALGIGWPHAVVMRETGERVLDIGARAGFDEEGMFCRVRAAGEAATEGVGEAMRAMVDAWARSLEGRPRMAGLAPVLSDYADALADLSGEVSLTYPNGAPFQTGVFCGVDVWGRASVRLASGELIEFAPERYQMVRA